MSDGRHSKAPLVNAFVALNITSALIFGLMIFSAILFRKTERGTAWYSFCVSWMMFGVSFALLSVAGQQFSAQDDRLCIAQTGLVYAAPFLVGSTTTALVIQLLTTVLETIYPSTSGSTGSTPLFKSLAVIVPWSVWTAVLSVVLVFSVKNPQHVLLSPNATFCVVAPGTSLIPRVTAVFTILFAVVVLSMEVAIGILLFRYRAAKDLLAQSIILASRVFAFTILLLVAAVTALAFALTDSRGIVFDLLIAITPIGCGIIFGCAPDLWQGYLDWLPESFRRRQGRNATQAQPGEVNTMATLSIRRETLVISSPLSPTPPDNDIL